MFYVLCSSLVFTYHRHKAFHIILGPSYRCWDSLPFSHLFINSLCPHALRLTASSTGHSCNGRIFWSFIETHVCAMNQSPYELHLLGRFCAAQEETKIGRNLPWRCQSIPFSIIMFMEHFSNCIRHKSVISCGWYKPFLSEIWGQKEDVHLYYQ